MSQSIQGGQFGFLRGMQEPAMLKAYYIPRLRLPSIGEFCCARRCGKSNAIGPLIVLIGEVNTF